MKKNVTYEDWKRLFQEETGHSAEEARYTPAHPIDVPVYLEHISSTHSRPKKQVAPEKEIKTSHTLILDQNTDRFIRDNIQILQQYPISKVLTVGFSTKEKKALMAVWNAASVSSVNLTRFDPGIPFYLNFQIARDDLSLVKKWRDEALTENFEIWYSPGDDFLWNVGLIRGLHQYFTDHHTAYWMEKAPAAYIDLHDVAHNESESQLIPLTNMLLSVAAAGINNFVWDIRQMTSWQKDHFHLLLNVPEILSRESRLYDYGDVVFGSSFFESLTGQISQYMAE